MNPLLADISHLENSSEFLCSLTDTDFRFLHTNRLFQKQFGLEHENWKGRPFTEVVGTFQMEKFIEANTECINNPGKTISIEIQTTTATHENWFRWEVCAILNGKNKVEGIRFLGTDITKQKRAEQTLLQQAILLDNISDAIISADHNFCIKSWNLKAEMMFNLKYEKESKNSLHEISKIDFLNDSESNFRKVVLINGSWNGDVLIEKNNGTKFYLQTMVNAIKDKTGKITGFVAVSRDVTKEHEIKNRFAFEQKKSQLDLVKEQKQFKTFMEYAPALAWLNDEDGILHYMNTLFKDTFDLPEDVIGKNVYDFYPASMKENCIAGDQEVLDKNTGIETFEERIDEEGEKHCYQVYKFPVGTHNQRRLIGGLAVNITGQVSDRMGIIKERNQFQSFMENAPLLAWITDANGVLHYMNTRFKSSFNYTDDHLNKKIGSIRPITEREKALLPQEDVLIKNKSIELFHEWVDESKKVHSYRTFKFPIQDVEGSYLEGGQSIEITSELLAQRALQRSNELFEYAGKATRDVIWDWDLKENKIRRTGGYKNLFGYKMTDPYEPHNYEKIHKDDIAKVLKIVKDAFKRSDSRWQMEYRYLCADGSYKIVIDQAYIIRNKNGKAVRVIGSMQDVTEERNLQEQVLITEKQKKKDVVDAVIAAQEKERKELSAELHDNVNQLLAASILYLKTAQKQKVIKENLITQSLDYVQKAVDELRDISRNLIPAELKMNGLSAALKAFAQKLHIPKSFEVKLVIGKLHENRISQPLKLAIYRIVQEIVNNILKHAHATKVTLHLDDTDGNLKLTVTDNGKGFDLKGAKKGLGITNIYNRAENFGGSADIISSAGKGCTWNIIIPLELHVIKKPARLRVH
ncbi:MAG: PAS domain S-box protein [Ginsengibacter sp.]